MTRDQTIALMAAAIYAAKRTANTYRARLETLRKESVREAKELFEQVLDDDQ